MNKLTTEYQAQFSNRLLYDPSVLERIDPHARLHEETKTHPLSSSAACLNVIGSLSNSPAGLIHLLGAFGLELDEILEFPSPVSFGNRLYRDRGYAVFEWVGPLRSPINERGGGRGYMRTSVDVFLLGVIAGRVTQILLEWKFTEGMDRPLALGKFSGLKGIERLRRYTPILDELKRKAGFPFDFAQEYSQYEPGSALGISDLSPDHLYQLLRMTLLAKGTVGMTLGKYTLQDYRVVHLTHSQNERINTLHPEYLLFSPGLQPYAGRNLHETWKRLLAPADREKFIPGHWDKALPSIEDEQLRSYLLERYGLDK